MMQSTILPPPEPLGAEDATTELCSEVSSTMRNNNHLLVNSSVVPGGTLTLVPVSTSTNNNNERHVKHRVSSMNCNNNSSKRNRSFGDISSLVEVMNQNTRAIL